MMSGGVLFLFCFFFFFFLILICVLNMIILYNINEGRSRCLFEHATKGKTKNTTLTLPHNGLVWFQTKKKKEENLKKRSEKSHHTCMFSIIHEFYIKQTCWRTTHRGLKIYISDIGMSEWKVKVKWGKTVYGMPTLWECFLNEVCIT